MTRAPHRFAQDIGVGVSAALRAPRRIESGLAELLAWPDVTTARAFAEARAERAIHAAVRTLWLLSLLPGNRWRNTCLFRSVAECAIRREYGSPARVVIGVDTVDGAVVAHAWVEQIGAHAADSRAMRPLHAARSAAVVG